MHLKAFSNTKILLTLECDMVQVSILQRAMFLFSEISHFVYPVRWIKHAEIVKSIQRNGRKGVHIQYG